MTDFKKNTNPLQNNTPPIQILHLFSASYSMAWKAFSKWWIPLCLVSGVWVFFDLLPSLLTQYSMSQKPNELLIILHKIVMGFNAQDYDSITLGVEQFNALSAHYMQTLLKFSLYLLPIALLVSTLLMAISVMAVQNKKKRYSLGTILKVLLASLLLTFIKIFLLILLFPLGVYLYIKLYFVSLFMLEKDQGMIEAIKNSWQLSGGYFWPLLSISVTNNLIQMAVSSTIVGLIPSTGFVRTTRTAAFELLRQDRSDKPAPQPPRL
jgi:hypothetical protein